MLFRDLNRVKRRRYSGTSQVTHRVFSGIKHLQRTKLAGSNRQEFMFNVDGEDLDDFPLN